MQERSAGTVIIHGNHYLLLHYEAGHWDFPKGKIEKGESPEEAALRELEEETGITDGRILPGFKERIKYFFRREGHTIAKEVIFFVAKTKTEQVTLSYEHIGFKWLPFTEAKKQLTFDNAKEVLTKAHAFLKNEQKS